MINPFKRTELKDKTPKDFERLTRAQFHQLWFNDCYTDAQIAKIYGVDKKRVKEKRKELDLGYFNSAFLSIMGGSKYADNKYKVR